MVPIIGALWPIVARTALVRVATGLVGRGTLGREIARDLIVSTIESTVVSITAQTTFAARGGNNTAVMSTMGGTVELAARVLESIRDKEDRNSSASYLAEVIMVHPTEGPKQKTAANLAMQAMYNSDQYYPLLVLGALYNLQPISDRRAAAIQAALLWAYWHNPVQYNDATKASSDAAVLTTRIDERDFWTYLSNTWIFWSDKYSPTIGQVVDEMEKSVPWLRLGNFVLTLRNIKKGRLDEEAATSLPGKSYQYHPVWVLNKIMDFYGAYWSDDRAILQLMEPSWGYMKAVEDISKRFYSTEIKGVFLLSVSGESNVYTNPSQNDLALPLSKISNLARGIFDPGTRASLADSLIELAERVKRDLT